MNENQPDFSSSVAIAPTDQGQAVETNEQPDFSNSEPLAPKVNPPRESMVSRVLYHALNIFPSPMQRMQADVWVSKNVADKSPDETDDQFAARLHQGYNDYDTHMVQGGIEQVLESPMDAAIAIGAVTHPVNTAAGVAGFTVLDNMLDLRTKFDNKFPDAAPEIKDLVSLGSMAVNVLILGGGAYATKRFVLDKHMEAAGVPKNVNIPSADVTKLNESLNLLPEEKADLKATLGITDNHIEAAQSSGLPVNIPTSKFIDLATKPYWEKVKSDLTGAESEKAMPDLMKTKTEAAYIYGDSIKNSPEKISELNTKEIAIKNQLDEINKIPYDQLSATQEQQQYDLAFQLQIVHEMKESLPVEKGGTADAGKRQGIEDTLLKQSKNYPDIKDLQGALADKDISNAQMIKLREFMSIDNLRKATPEQIKKVTDMVGDLKPGDKFLSEKQLASMDEILKSFSVPEVTPKRIIMEKLGEEILPKGILSKVAPELVPSVEIKSGNPVITKIVNNARDLMDNAEREISRRNETLDKMLLEAEKSRAKLLDKSEQFKRALANKNTEIFQALGGAKVELTKEEAAVVSYLKDFFAKAKEDLQLEKYRTNYVTHMEKPLTEKILDKGLFPTIREFLAGTKDKEIPTELMLELENIIGSEKFFKYAMERKGGMDPTTNLRRIINGYSSLYETKLALDKVLPEGQAVVHTLLKGKSALWMKRYLQNLKGRGMDYNFRTGPMGWLAKTADAIVDVGYIKLLALDPWSALKNIVAGETNNWIYHDFKTYLTGKQRMAENRKKAIEMAQNFGMLDGTYADYAQRGIGSLKKLQDFAMIGQRIGEQEIRASIMASMLTKEEWASGKISRERVNSMKDVIALTQGIFSKTDSPLFVQTWYGRMFMQMNRWRITNALLMRRIVSDGIADMKAGKYDTPAVTRLGKSLIAYGIGMYISSQLYQAGHKKAGDVAKNMAQTIDGIASLVTAGDLVKMFTDNPTLSMFKEFSHSIQNTAAYLHVPGAKHTQERGIENTYVAPVKIGNDLLNTLEQQ